MSTSTPQDGGDGTVTAPQGTATAGEGQGGDGTVTPSREAARYRTRLREVEAERDGLREQLDGLRRREVERLAGEQLAQPGDLLALGGIDLDALCGEDGQVDEQLVGEAVETLLTQRPGLGVAPPPPGFDGGARGAPASSPASWSQVLSGARR